MELKEARDIAEEIRIGKFKILAKTKSNQTIASIGISAVVLDNRITELEKQIKSDTGYREIKRKYKLISKENWANYERANKAEAEVGRLNEMLKER